MQFDAQKTFAPTEPFDHQALLSSLADLESRFPFLEIGYLGKSILGRGIPSVTIGHGSRQVLYVGAHHGMEWLTSALLVRMISDFCLFYESGRCVGKISPRVVFGTHSLTIIPMLNPDGVEYQIHGVDAENPLYERLKGMNESFDFSRWQANARGVDLNHNYDAGFSAYKALEAKNGITGGCATRYSGESPESEPEVHALCNYIRYQKNLRGIMTLHTQGEEIYYKSGDQCPRGADAVARRLSVLCGYVPSAPEGLASFGGLTDWCVQKMNIPSFTVECGRGENPLPISDFLPIYMGLRPALFAFPTLL